MMNIKLTMRQVQILRYFLEHDDFTSPQPLADRLGVSLRTLQRELAELDLYLDRFGIRFRKKFGRGMKLHGDEAALAELAGQLRRQADAAPDYTAEERQAVIKHMLLSGKEPVKLYALGKALHVAESTVSYDLQKIEPWLAKYGIRLHRRPGLGVYIEGTEKQIRAALADLLYENVTQEQLMTLIYGREEARREKLRDEIRSRLLNFIDPAWLLKIEQVIQQMEQKRGYPMADNAYVGFVVRLALAAQRLKNREEITIEREILERLKATPEFDLASELADRLSEKLELAFPESEIGYITMHLLGARSNNVMSSDYDYSVLEDYTKRMISVMEQELRLELGSDDRLADNLTTHLRSAVKRIELGMPVRNPLLQHVKTEYPDDPEGVALSGTGARQTGAGRRDRLSGDAFRHGDSEPAGDRQGEVPGAARLFQRNRHFAALAGADQAEASVAARGGHCFAHAARRLAARPSAGRSCADDAADSDGAC
ncbi:Mannitol PTS operon transcriptional regulator [Thermobacillus xylanilyticus]|uniref:Mannitol PTS operon transcriptional regulator n=1 Tax=Thermobacillus xylanilyticus TaxID=76633 RepID=A0ABM8V7R4_THEXY|nr:Mannitol PTS operon transcriptional regulator [Thermobacillus xylanilyticus]